MRRAAVALVLGLLVGACTHGAGEGPTSTQPATSTSALPTSTTTTTAPTTTTTPNPVTTTTLGTTTSTTPLPAFPGREELAAARALWAEQRLNRYRFRATAYSAWGVSGPYEVYVDGDRVVEVALGSASGSFTGLTPYLRFFGPVEYLFAVVESVPDGDLTVVYDPQRGHPNLIEFNDPGCADEEWGLEVRLLEPFDGPMPEEAALPPPDPAGLELVERFSSLAALVVARVAGPVGVTEGFSLCERTWEIAVDVEQAVIIDPAWAPVISPGSRVLIQDLGGLHPRALWGLEGARVLLPLAYYDGHLGQGWISRRWAGVVTDEGLDFVGAMAGLYQAEMALLCESVLPGITVQPELGLPLLLAWAEGMAGGQDSETARQAACRTTGSDADS